MSINSDDKAKIKESLVQIINDLQEEENEWVNLARIGNELSKQGIEIKQYNSKLKSFLEEFSDIIEFDRIETDGNPPVFYARLIDNQKARDEVSTATTATMRSSRRDPVRTASKEPSEELNLWDWASTPNEQYDNSSKTDSEKTGFFRIGFIENREQYLDQLCELAGISRSDFNSDDFNKYIDEQWNDRVNKVCCYDKLLNTVEASSKEISVFLINTGYTDKNSGDPLYAKFNSSSPASLDEKVWRGIELGIKNALLKQSDSFKTFSYVGNYNLVLRVLQDITGQEFNLETCQKVVNDSYILATENNTLNVVVSEHDSKKQIAFFPLADYTSKNGKKLFIKMDKNKNPNNQKWFGAFVTTEDELKDELLSYFTFHVGYFIFDSLSDSNYFFNSLAEKAMKEKWQWSNENQDSRTQPILQSYLEHTYYRLLDEDAEAADDNKKIIKYNGKCYFNSGLLDSNFRQIIIVGDDCTKEMTFPGLGECQWNMISNISAYSHNEEEIAGMFGDVNNLPKIASYFENYSDVVFNARLAIHLKDNHVFEDGVARGRLPKYQEEYEKVRENEKEKERLISKIAADFGSATERAKLMAERNYKLAVPQFWRETGEIQFLLPIYLSDEEEAEKLQCALVLSLDKDRRVPYYRGETILTLDMAYNNTRLIAKPDVFWLNDLV